MKVDGMHRRTIEGGPEGVAIIDQTRLPFALVWRTLTTLDDAAHAIASMQVRGAPLIGATAAWGLALAARADPSLGALEAAGRTLAATRPTAINLKRVVDDVTRALREVPQADRARAAAEQAQAVCEAEVARSLAIGRHGLEVLRALHARLQRPLQVLTHCNAGWLATVDWGTALAPLYLAHQAGLPLHVWVDETRPRNQGASLTAWELGQEGVPHTLIVDNAGGLLMRQGKVDLCIVGTDRVALDGDVCNKVGTYLKALAAHDCGVPFWVAAPESSVDWALASGDGVPIEERGAEEVTHLCGLDEEGALRRVRVTPAGVAVHNPGFDVTPARLVTGLLTERGPCAASREGLLGLFPERQAPTEGVVRYRTRHAEAPLPLALQPVVEVLDGWRARLKGLGLVGQDGVRYGGVGWGNVSARLEGERFLISGTQTGGLERTDARHYVVVDRCDDAAAGGEVWSRGPVAPSSEAMSHAALYAARPEARFVLHGHAPALWRRGQALGLPATPEGVEYGTVAMARAFREVLSAQPPGQPGVLVMGGHEDGVVSWGATAEDAGRVLLEALARSVL
jgi:methylthioribose-1-phosphate isomerase